MSPPRLFDRQLLSRRLDRAAKAFAQAQFLRERSIEDLLHSLGAVNRRFDVALEIGARDGGFAKALAASPDAGKIGLLIEADVSQRFIGQAQGPARLIMDEEELP
ncbi:MAG: SAM-dependent methyltransferase, partial [Asticcacaulis sp.]|nr:SAM-dependent methyltransferase [Asticcacaulis sp.]